MTLILLAQAPTPAVYASVWLPTFVSPHVCRSKEEGLSASIIDNTAYVQWLVGIQVPQLMFLKSMFMRCSIVNVRSDR